MCVEPFCFIFTPPRATFEQASIVFLTFALSIGDQGQLLEAKKQLETQNTLQQKTRELLRTSEQQVAALKAQLASASSSESTASTPVTRAASLRAPLRGSRCRHRI